MQDDGSSSVVVKPSEMICCTYMMCVGARLKCEPTAAVAVAVKPSEIRDKIESGESLLCCWVLLCVVGSEGAG